MLDRAKSNRTVDGRLAALGKIKAYTVSSKHDPRKETCEGFCV